MAQVPPRVQRQQAGEGLLQRQSPAMPVDRPPSDPSLREEPRRSAAPATSDLTQASPPATPSQQPHAQAQPQHASLLAPEGEPPLQTPPIQHSDPVEEPPADPEDWSQELAALDLQLRRLGWAREQESIYLQRAFGHPSRSRLTHYSDLRAYLLALEGLERGSDPAVATVPLRRSELLAQGDALLLRLGWSAEQGRAFLGRELQRVSRQQLSDVQLLQFNMLLEGELLAADNPTGDVGSPSAERGADAPAR